MRWSVRIFRVSGISVELHVTFILFALLMLMGGGLQPLLFLLLVFSVVLAHELVHSLTAVMHGINVPKITLTPIGGLASIELPEDPMLELKVSIVGPMFNFMLAFACLGILLALSPGILSPESLSTDNVINLMESDPVTGVLLMMVSINLTLGAFNMLPAFPMDGGRVFRSVLAFWMDYERATRIASNVGQVFFIVFGLFWLIVYDSLWGAIIGFFLSYAGGSEIKYVGLKRLLGDLTLGEIAEDRLSYVNASLSWAEFVSTVYRKGRNVYLVTDSAGVLKGVIDLSDGAGVHPKMRVGDMKNADYAVLDGRLKVTDALRELLAKRLVLVMVEGRLIGYVTPETLAESTAYLSIVRSAK